MLRFNVTDLGRERLSAGIIMGREIGLAVCAVAAEKKSGCIHVAREAVGHAELVGDGRVGGGHG